jgi:hypothetical protein
VPDKERVISENGCVLQHSKSWLAMSPLGQKRRFRPHPAMSAITPEATAITTCRAVQQFCGLLVAPAKFYPLIAGAIPNGSRFIFEPIANSVMISLLRNLGTTLKVPQYLTWHCGPKLPGKSNVYAVRDHL